VCEVAGIKINENDEINEIAPFSLLSVVVVLFPVLGGRRNCFWRFRYSQLSANFWNMTTTMESSKNGSTTLCCMNFSGLVGHAIIFII